MTRDFTPHEIGAMNLAADAEDGKGCDRDLIALMIRTYRHEPGAGMFDVLRVVRAYDGARRET